MASLGVRIKCNDMIEAARKSVALEEPEETVLRLRAALALAEVWWHEQRQREAKR